MDGTVPCGLFQDFSGNGTPIPCPLGSLHSHKGMRGPIQAFFLCKVPRHPSFGLSGVAADQGHLPGSLGATHSCAASNRHRSPDLLTSHFSRNSPCYSRVSLVAISLACGMDSAVPAGLGFSSISKPRTDVLGYVQVVPSGLDQGRQKPTRFIGSAIIRSPIRGGD